MERLRQLTTGPRSVLSSHRLQLISRSNSVGLKGTNQGIVKIRLEESCSRSSRRHSTSGYPLSMCGSGGSAW
jgi:hypothetical protein